MSEKYMTPQEFLDLCNKKGGLYQAFCTGLSKDDLDPSDRKNKKFYDLICQAHRHCVTLSIIEGKIQYRSNWSYK